MQKTSLSRVQTKLDKTNIKWAVFAGGAARCYGSKRRLTDLDLLVRKKDFWRATRLLNGMKEVDIVADLRLNANGKIYRFYMDKEMIKHIQRKFLLGVKIPVIPVEDNIILKCILQRGEKEDKHDIADIRSMIANEKVDLDYLRNRVRFYEAKDRVYPILRDMGLKIAK